MLTFCFLGFVDPQVNPLAGTTAFYHPGVTLAPGGAPLTYTQDAASAAAAAMAARVGVNPAIGPGTRIDQLGSATQQAIPQLATGSAADLKKDFVASGVQDYNLV